MTSFKLILKNVQKNLQDYFIYFLTLMLSVSMFYAFNSIESQPALKDLSMTKQLLADQLRIFISLLSVIVAFVLGFLILYANQFLLKRRTKELGIYTLLGMKKGRISGIFVGETFCVGALSLLCGLGLGLILSQVLSLLALRLFAVELEEYRMIFSISAFGKTIGCFVVIFLIVMAFNVRTISKVKLIDLLTAERKNDRIPIKNRVVQVILFLLSIAFLASSCILIKKYGILPSRENQWFKLEYILLALGVVLFFFSVSAVLLTAVQRNPRIYSKGLNTFLSRQIAGKIRMDFLTLSVICGLLVVSICGITIGASSAITMNEASKEALPFDLNVLTDVEIAGDCDISEYLKTRGVDMETYAKDMAQISLCEEELTYGDLFSGQDVSLWSIDEGILDLCVYVISVSDFNQSLEMQGKEPVKLDDGEFLMNCNYKGTRQYIDAFMEKHDTVSVNGTVLHAGSREALSETYWMTSVGNNDRGSLIVPDMVAKGLRKDANVLLVNYKEGTNSDEVLQKMIPIGLEWETEGYRYTEKNMLNEMYYGTGALLVFLCCYIGLIFLFVCAVLLSLKQMTETADNVLRYGLLRKLGARESWLYGALLRQISVFFLAPFLLAGILSAFGIREITGVIEEFMNMHIASHIGLTALLFFLVYGGYFLATYLSCRKMIQDRKIKRESTRP